LPIGKSPAGVKKMDLSGRAELFDLDTCGFKMGIFGLNAYKTKNNLIYFILRFYE
jgi:hypothetical protein